MRAAFCWGILVVAVNTHALAADLDAPLEQKPTLGSEIRRGVAAARQCYLKDDNTIQPINFADCIVHLDDSSDQASPSFKAFSLGVHYGAWHWETIEADVARSNPSDELQKSVAEVAAQFAPGDFTIWRVYQRELGVTDLQILTLADVPIAVRKETLAEFKEWDSTALH